MQYVLYYEANIECQSFVLPPASWLHLKLVNTTHTHTHTHWDKQYLATCSTANYTHRRHMDFLSLSSGQLIHSDSAPLLNPASVCGTQELQCLSKGLTRCVLVLT